MNCTQKDCTLFPTFSFFRQLEKKKESQRVSYLTVPICRVCNQYWGNQRQFFYCSLPPLLSFIRAPRNIYIQTVLLPKGLLLRTGKERYGSKTIHFRNPEGLRIQIQLTAGCHNRNLPTLSEVIRGSVMKATGEYSAAVVIQ